jgi:hypothetical protein
VMAITMVLARRLMMMMAMVMIIMPHMAMGMMIATMKNVDESNHLSHATKQISLVCLQFSFCRMFGPLYFTYFCIQPF